ncbi:MAG: hypothetical protein KDA24_21150 [Deltaproteobacteria bacterium]|nr:hypothetical protein [Deltaproteobacteria bacterium]
MFRDLFGPEEALFHGDPSAGWVGLSPNDNPAGAAGRLMILLGLLLLAGARAGERS